ncbi:sugar transferase [Isoptericola sp. b441]|uniref:Sugar transferase n=1 Tax=Actinotalea lenta TaxID=3064654 RepID=A0ABT9DBW8_9CELL|nr:MULTISPECIES: sugar transferase [unclassified Isoptericola]MDO8106796.1 sugar transferase [Isoptericola sp. b441]MDO8121493.1 sugar transferase [Isoptericola sp. b490]
MSAVTLAVDDSAQWPLESDRRGLAVEPRRSWASPQPAELRGTPFNDSRAAARRWPVVARGHQRRTLAIDLVVATAVTVPFLVSVLGWSWQVPLFTACVVGGLVVLVMLTRGYDVKHLGDGPEEYQAVLRAGSYGAALVIGLSYAGRIEVSRFLVFVGMPVLMLALMAVRYAGRRVLHRARAKGLSMRNTLLVGTSSDVEGIAQRLASATYHGYDLSGVCLPSIDECDRVAGLPVVGAVADVAQVVVDRAVDVVVVAGPSLSPEALRRLSWALDRVGAQLVVVPGLVEVTGPRITLRPAAGLSLLELEVAAPRRRLVAKSVLDRVAGISLMIAAAPIIAVAALAVRLTSRGPAFYRQTRVGVDGTPFTMWKLRSMYVDADRRRAALAESSDGNGVLFKMRADPRVTPVGRVLRRYSIDELPQLLNVVRGDMSLVGPRPPLGEEVAAYEDAVHRRLRVRPGLTGLWQVSGRSDLTWEESVRLDLRYVDNWSVTMDLMILWKTARAVLRGSGAY